MKINPQVGPRLYKKGRGSYPSVTEVLKITQGSHIEQWKRRVGEKEARAVLESTGAFGTAVHVIAEDLAWAKYQWSEAKEDFKPYARAIEGFLSNHVQEVLGTEIELVSERYKFGGTLDLYCILKDGSMAVVDYKTTAQLTREHGLQTAAYALLMRDNNMPVNRRLVVRIKKDKPGEYFMREYKEHEEDVKAFLGLVAFWYWKNKKWVGENSKQGGVGKYGKG